MTCDARLALRPAQVEQYHRDGFIVVRRVFTGSEVGELDREARHLLERTDLIDPDNLRCRWQDCVSTGECRFDCFDPVIDIGPVCARVARDVRLAGLLASLCGEPARLFKDKLIFKPPGARGYPLHQDYIAWPSFPRSFVTIMLAIDPCGAANGATEVFAGCHRSGPLVPHDGLFHEVPSELVAPGTGVVLELEPGDVAVFSGFTPHRSGPNHSAESRRVLYLSYNHASEGGDQREAHYRQFAGWLRDRYAEYGKVNTFFR